MAAAEGELAGQAKAIRVYQGIAEQVRCITARCRRERLMHKIKNGFVREGGVAFGSATDH